MKEEKKKILELRELGKLYKEIQEELGVSLWKINKVLKEEGRVVKYKNITEQERKRIVEMRKEGKTLTVIAEEIGVVPSRVNKILKESKEEIDAKGITIVKEKKEKIVRLREEGRSYREISEEVGVSAQSIGNVLKSEAKHLIKIDKKKVKLTEGVKRKILELSTEKTEKEIGEELEIPVDWVRGVKKESKIERKLKIEEKVLKLKEEGRSYREIGRELGVSVYVIKKVIKGKQED